MYELPPARQIVAAVVFAVLLAVVLAWAAPPSIPETAVPLCEIVTDNRPEYPALGLGDMDANLWGC